MRETTGALAPLAAALVVAGALWPERGHLRASAASRRRSRRSSPVAPGVIVDPIITVGETLRSGYRFESIPDGIALVKVTGNDRRRLRQPRDVDGAVPVPRRLGFNDFTNAMLSKLTLPEAERGRARRRVRDPVRGRTTSASARTSWRRRSTASTAPLIFANEEATDCVYRTGEAWPAAARGAEQAGVVVAYDVGERRVQGRSTGWAATTTRTASRSRATAIRSCSRATTRSSRRRRSSTCTARRTRAQLWTDQGDALRVPVGQRGGQRLRRPVGDARPSPARSSRCRRRSRRAIRRRSSTGRTRTTSSSSSASRTSPTTATERERRLLRRHGRAAGAARPDDRPADARAGDGHRGPVSERAHLQAGARPDEPAERAPACRSWSTATRAATTTSTSSTSSTTSRRRRTASSSRRIRAATTRARRHARIWRYDISDKTPGGDRARQPVAARRRRRRARGSRAASSTRSAASARTAFLVDVQAADAGRRGGAPRQRSRTSVRAASSLLRQDPQARALDGLGDGRRGDGARLRAARASSSRCGSRDDRGEPADELERVAVVDELLELVELARRAMRGRPARTSSAHDLRMRGRRDASRRSAQSSSCSFSPGRAPTIRIATSRSGSLPESRIILRARSTIFTGSPMSSTRDRPRPPIAPACTTSETASGIVMKKRVISGCGHGHAGRRARSGGGRSGSR